MKKTLLSVVLALMCFGLATAYNPPAGGELLYQLSAPQSLSDGASAAGGALFYATADHTAVNPALVASEQRVVLNLGATGLFGPDTDPGFGTALNLGAVVPTMYGVFSGTVQGVFTPFKVMSVGSSGTVRGGFAKEITETISVGASIATTFGKGFGAFCDLGVFWNKGSIRKLPFLKDVRIGFALTELGLPYSDSTANGISSGASSGFPGWVTPRAGIAGTFFSTDSIKAGVSADLALPSFQNIIANLGLQALIADVVRIRTGWQFNLRECIAGKASYYPDVALSVKIVFRSKEDSFLTKQGWQQSELIPSAAYRQLPGGVNAYSAELAAHLGLKDTDAPTIELWGDDYE